MAHGTRALCIEDDRDTAGLVAEELIYLGQHTRAINMACWPSCSQRRTWSCAMPQTTQRTLSILAILVISVLLNAGVLAQSPSARRGGSLLMTSKLKHSIRA